MSKLKRNIIYNIGYQFLIIIVPFITAPYLSRVLGVEGVGVYSYTSSVDNYFVLFSMLGLSNYGNRSIAAAENIERRSKIFSSIFYMQVIWALVVSGVYGIYVLLFVHQYKLIAGIQFLYVISAVIDINWFYFGIEEFRLTVLRNIAIKMLTLICIFTFVKSEDDLWKYTLIMSFGMLLSQGIVWGYLPQFARFVKVEPKDVIKHIKPNIILFVPVISYSIYKVMDKIMLGNMTTYSTVGIYEYAEKIINIPMGIIAAFGTVMLPRISNMLTYNASSEIKRYFQLSAKYMTMISSALSFGLIAVGKTFAPLYYGIDFKKSGDIIEVLAITVLFVTWANIIRTQYLIPFHRDSVYLLSTVMGAVVNFGVNITLISRLGAYGAAVGTVCAEATVLLIQMVGTCREIHYWKLFRDIIPSIIISIIMCIFVKKIGDAMVGGWTKLLAMVLTGAVIYTFLIFIYYGCVKKDDMLLSFLKITKK